MLIPISTPTRMKSAYVYPSEREIRAMLAHRSPKAKASTPASVFGSLKLLDEIQCMPAENVSFQQEKNLQVVSIMLEGVMVHKNAAGVLEILPERGIQSVSSGPGLAVSEFNPAKHKKNRYLRIGIMPKDNNPLREYDQIASPPAGPKNQFRKLASPYPDTVALTLCQDAWVWIGRFDSRQPISYELKKSNNGIYGYIIDGQLQVDGQILEPGDHFAIADCDRIRMHTLDMDTQLLLVEVPFSWRPVNSKD